MNKNTNPLLSDFNEAPFAEIKNEHFKPAFEVALKEAREEIDEIANSKQPPTFANTIEALEFSGGKLDRISSIFFNLNSAETNDTIQQIAQEVSPWLSKFQNDVALNTDVFEKVKTVYQQRKQLDLTKEQETLLDKKYKSFERNGANLSDTDKTTLREIDTQLATLKLTFGEHVLAATNAFELHIKDANELAGLPDYAMEAAALEAKNRSKEGYVFTLQYPSYVPFMKYAQNRALRKKLSLAFGGRAFQEDANDNRKHVLTIAQLRYQRAQLLGFETHAHYVLAERMAETPEKVNEFLKDLMHKALPAAKREFEELTAYAKEKDGIDELQKWDGSYYAEQLKKDRYALDDAMLKPYFKLENVIDGVFTIASKLFGLRFEEVTDVPVYHKEVKTYKVYDHSGNYKSLFYADFHPRKGKRAGAWMTSYKSQYMQNGINERPHISNVCNFTPSTAENPSLLTFNEVTTLFHEFGHGLHGMLANTTYPSLSGTSVYWDFVELPSQLLENWCYEPEALALFATHYQTGETLPTEIIDRIRKAATFHEGMQTLRQLSFGMLDMAWHATDPSKIEDVKAFEEAVFAETALYPDTPSTCMSTSFSHIFQGGYAAGYYSYKWAEVLDADAFEFFKEQGVLNNAIGKKFETHILSQGGTEHPMTLYKRFRGREPQAEALLRRAGLIALNK